MKALSIRQPYAWLIVNGIKDVKAFGYSKGGDPLHPLMLGYDTALVPCGAGEVPRG